MTFMEFSFLEYCANRSFFSGTCIPLIILSAAIIRGNHTNCSQFAQAQRLNWLFSKLGSQVIFKFHLIFLNQHMGSHFFANENSIRPAARAPG